MSTTLETTAPATGVAATVTATPTAPATPPAPAAPQNATQPQGDGDLGDAGKAALKAIREEKAAEAKARKAAEDKAAELETELAKIRDKDLSDVDRARKELEQARRDVDAARRDALRFRVAAKHGISEDDAALFLTASDEAGISAQAERFAAATKAAADTAAAAAEAAAGPKTPRPDPSQGARGGAARPSVQSGAERRLAELKAQRDAQAALNPAGSRGLNG